MFPKTYLLTCPHCQTDHHLTIENGSEMKCLKELVLGIRKGTCPICSEVIEQPRVRDLEGTDPKPAPWKPSDERGKPKCG